MKSPQGSIIEAIEKATPDDLEDVQDQIDALQRRIDSLKAVEKVLKIKLHGKPPKLARGTAKVRATVGTGAFKERRNKIAEYLLHAGPTRPMVLVEQLKIPPGSMTAVLDHPWFEKTTNGVTLTPEGRKAVG